MAETIFKIVKYSAIITVVTSLILTLMSLLLFITSSLTVALNTSVIGDIMILVQMWLPFNLFPLIAWLFTVSSLYLTYKLARFIFDYSRQFLSL